jgi:hypothetical protein
LNPGKLDARIWLIPAAGLAVYAGATLLRWVRRPRDPEDAERRRRARINQIGRIAEGRVLDIMEVAPTQEDVRGLARLTRPRQDGAPADLRKLVCYSYSISGVSYETAQDITSLSESAAALDRLVAGQPASVKYDPVNPSNSIVVADNWSGVH